MDLIWTFYHLKSMYLIVFKIFFIASSGYTLYLMLNDYKPTRDPNSDTFKVEYLLLGSALLALLFPYKYTIVEVLWSFSIWLESVAILPQLFMLQRTGEAETITTHYLFALGVYRALYIPNWFYRWLTEPDWSDKVAVVAGLIQTVLYTDFFYIYYTRYAAAPPFKKIGYSVANCCSVVLCKARNSTFPCKRVQDF
jgi:ER lumen protein retaining receptor